MTRETDSSKPKENGRSKLFVTPKRMRARVISEKDARKSDFETDVRNNMGYFDGCTQRTFGQRMRARYGTNPGCAQPTSRMHAIPLIDCF